MTLIAGFRCTDGFVIAADTEVTIGNVSVQGPKLTRSGLGDGRTFCIGFAGDVSYGLSASQSIRDAILTLTPLTFASIRQAIDDVLGDLHDNHMLRDWQVVGVVPAPSVSLIIGVEDTQRDFRVFRTDLNCVYEVDHSTFAGSGHELAASVCERVFNAFPLSTAVTEHLARQVFREIKSKGPYVGGNTEIFSRRSFPKAEQFFDIDSLRKEYRFLWGLDDALTSAIRVAVGTHHRALPGRKLPGILEERLAFIRKRLTALYIASSAERTNAGDERWLTEFDTEYGNPFKDL